VPISPWSAGANVDTKLTFLPPEVSEDVGRLGLSPRGGDWLGDGPRRLPPQLSSPRRPPMDRLRHREEPVRLPRRDDPVTDEVRDEHHERFAAGGVQQHLPPDLPGVGGAGPG